MGFVNIVTNAAGNVVESHSFDAWGRRRSTTDFSYLTAFNSAGLLGSRGYTFHEHLDQFGLINMNGRLYDPQLGRMLSPDPVVITNASLNFNAYSYANNNPFKYTDPSGEFAPLIIIAAIASAALVGGTLNLVSAALSGKIKNIGDAFAYFGAGAIGGAVALYNPALGFGLTAALNVGADFATGNAYNVRGDASSGVNFLTLGFSVIDGFNAVSGGQIGQIVFRKLLEKSTRPVLTLAAKELTQLPAEQLAKQTAATGIKGVQVTVKEIGQETLEQTGKNIIDPLAYAGQKIGKSEIKYIGRLDDLKDIPRSQTLLDQLPNLGNPKANYYQNMSVLRKTIREGYTIKDASWFRPNSQLAPTLLNPNRTVGQTFLGAERLLLKNRGLWP